LITCLKGKWVVGFKDNKHCLYEDGIVVYSFNKVLYVGHSYEGHIDKTEDLGNVLIGPGFIDLDAIVDLDSTVLAFDNQPGWKKGRIPSTHWKRRETYNREQLKFNKLYSFNMLLLNGITTVLPITSVLYRQWAETYQEFIDTADMAEMTGIRAFLGPAYMSGYARVNQDHSFDMYFDEQKGMQGLQDGINYIEHIRASYSSRIDGFLAPDRIEGCTPTLLQETAYASKKLSSLVRLHSCQGSFEIDMIDKLHGVSSIDYISKNDLLSERLLLPHLQFLGGKTPSEEKINDELSMLAQSGANAVVCPIVAGRNAKYFSSVSKFKKLGINIALGTDTFPVDMIQNMHIGTILSRVNEGDVLEASALDYYNMATIGGADAIGRSDLGRLCEGSAADIVIFDFDSVYTGQNFDPITSMIINGNGRDVKAVIVDGIKRVWENELVDQDCDMESMHNKAQQQFNEFKKTYPERSFGDQTMSEIFPSSMPIIKKEDK